MARVQDLFTKFHLYNWVQFFKSSYSLRLQLLTECPQLKRKNSQFSIAYAQVCQSFFKQVLLTRGITMAISTWDKEKKQPPV